MPKRKAAMSPMESNNNGYNSLSTSQNNLKQGVLVNSDGQQKRSVFDRLGSHTPKNVYKWTKREEQTPTPGSVLGRSARVTQVDSNVSNNFGLIRSPSDVPIVNESIAKRNGFRKAEFVSIEETKRRLITVRVESSGSLQQKSTPINYKIYPMFELEDDDGDYDLDLVGSDIKLAELNLKKVGSVRSQQGNRPTLWDLIWEHLEATSAFESRGGQSETERCSTNVSVQTTDSTPKSHQEFAYPVMAAPHKCKSRKRKSFMSNDTESRLPLAKRRW